MWLLGDLWCNLMREDEVFLLNDFWSHLSQSIKLSLKFGLSFRSGSVHSKGNSSVLVGMGERIEQTVSFTIVIWVVKHVTSISEPGWLWHFIVEESRAHTLAVALESQPLENIRFLSITRELHWGPFRVHIVHAVIPGLSGVLVDFPTSISVFSLCPVWDGETLVDCSWSSVERNVADTLKKGVWVEVLSVHVHVDHGLLVEFIVVDIFHSQTCLSRLLDVESVGDVEEVRMNEAHGV